MTTPALTEKGSLFSPTFLSPAAKSALLSVLWPVTIESQHTLQQNEKDLEAYFAYFQQECRPDISHDHAIQGLEDFATVLGIIRSNTSVNLSGVRTLIANAKAALASDERKLSLLMELVVRLWIMINVRILMPSHRSDLEMSLPWPDSESLVAVLRRHISQPSLSFQSTTDDFSPYLNAVQMRDIASFQVLWTNNLGDHLRMRGSSLYMFHHVSVLKRLRNSAISNDFLPAPLIDETLATINLIVPHSMPSCNGWLKTQINHMGLDPDIWYRETADSRKSVYVYWPDRLLSVSEAFDRSKPSNPLQWWHDRRDMGQWWGFWLVMAGIFLTVIFGLIQSITGILQVVKSNSE